MPTQTGKRNFGNKGFTLIEILIVVMVLGILAMVIIPQITVSTEDAKTSTLQTNLGALRNAVELYYHQHDNKYPGVILTKAGLLTADAASAEIAFLNQLTQYTKADGSVSITKNVDFPFGPYLKGGGFTDKSF